MDNNNCYCGAAESEHQEDCLICGARLLYSEKTVTLKCVVCGREYLSNAVCENGHFVCDDCHRGKADSFVPMLLESGETDPEALFELVVAIKGVHMHGPEHHVIVPCVLLTSYKNSGGDIDLTAALSEAVKRASQVPGGVCGYWGVCGAAAGAGIFASIALGSNPLNTAVWDKPQRLVSRCLSVLADFGGCRCCKRVGRLCIELAAKFSTETLGVPMTAKPVICHYCAQSHECIGKNCPYFPKHMNLDITADSNARSVIEAYPQSWEYFRAIGLCCVDAAEGTVSEVCRAHGIEPNSFTQALCQVLF